MKQIILFLLSLFVVGFTYADDIPPPPDPPRLVNDFANVMTAGQIASLEADLVDFERKTSTQILIVTVTSLEGLDASEYSFRLGEKWGVGQKGKDNGVIILFKPKTERERGQVFVAVGYGLEGVIPDATANSTIVNREMIPRFQQNDIYGGLRNGVNIIMALVGKEFTAQEYEEKVGAVSVGLSFLVLVLLLVFFVILFSNMRRRYYTGGSNLPLWILMAGMMRSGRDRGGSFDNFSSGSGGFSSGGGFSGGGGGFGGFGGGSFGGGGAGGSW